ncbi:MAG: amino acid ABC transporter permease [Magnetococcales bacterium]|nr:amino acid ABC transporter permease [Magnetococcales bacterium]NGZ28551.1 amino acid ABC transporter permease [Magnetococcales bacterium]
MGYHWDWLVFLQTVPSGETTYLAWLLTGAGWTILLSLSGWLLALLVGGAVGVANTLPWPWLTRMATGYVELFRNIPLLVQLFLWYFVLPEVLPTAWGNAIKQSHPLTQQFLAAWLCLGLFTAARVAEQVRAGIQSLPVGQYQAAQALGLSRSQSYRHVLLPVALRLILPTLTSEFINIFKNSAVATTIGLVELSRQAQQLSDYSAHPYEAFIAVTFLYLIINLVVTTLMIRLERGVALPGQGGKPP